MEIENKGLALELILNCVPYNHQLSEINLEHEGCIYFKWRSSGYKLELRSGSVYMTDGGCLIGNDTSILMTELIRRQNIDFKYSRKSAG